MSERLNRTARSILTLNRDREYGNICRLVTPGTMDRLLDVGSGDGFWTVRFARQCANVIGLEPDTVALRYALALHRRPNLAFVEGSAESLPFPDSSFDKVVSISSLEHFGDPLQALREMARVLKPGGRIGLSVDSLSEENSSASFREWHRRRHLVTNYFSQDELEEALDEAGLQADETVHLLTSRIAVGLRQAFVRHPRYWLPMFPLFYSAVRLADQISNGTHGQIIVASARR
jgi:ubiquinone/menaquinone biosynthesis C-methylase UbiE